MRKKILSLVMTLVLMASVLPMSVLAAEDGVLPSPVKFRGVELSGTELVKLEKETGITTAGNKELPVSAAKSNFPVADDAPSKFDLGDNTGEAKAYLVDGAEAKKWTTTDLIKEGLNQAKMQEIDLNAPEIKSGQYLVVDVVTKDGTTHTYYACQLNVAATAKTDVGDVTVTSIKGKKQTKGGTSLGVATEVDDEKSANLQSCSNDSNLISLEYEEATSTKEDAGKTEITTNERTAKIEVVTTTALKASDSENVKKAFDDALAAGNTLEGTQPLNVGPEGGRIWVVARATAEDGKTCKYYVWLVEVKAQPGAEKVTKIELDKTQTEFNFGSEIEFTGNLNGGDTPEAPEVLTAKVPLTVMDGTEKDVELKALKVTLVSDGDDMVVSTGNQLASASSNEATYSNVQGKPASNKVTMTADFSGGKALYVKTSVTVEDKPVNKYYKLVVDQEAKSNDAFIKNGSVIGDAKSTAVTGEIVGELNKKGTNGDFAELSAEVPYVNGARWEAYDQSTVEITVDYGATVKYIKTESIYTSIDAEDFTDEIEAKDAKSRDKSKGISTYVVPKASGTFDAHKERIYILVTAEDKMTQNIYVLDNITMAEPGSEANLVEVIPTQNNKEMEDGNYQIVFSEGTGEEKDNPINITITIPYRSSSEDLSANLTASYAAKITYYGTTKFVTPKTMAELGKLTVGEVNYLKVDSNDGTKTTYYTIVIKIGELKDATAEDDVELDLQSGRIIVDNGEISADDLKNGLESGSPLKVLDSKNNEVTATGKVGTGYKVVAGGTEVDVVVKGDVTGDAVININDAVEVLRANAGDVQLGELNAIAADVDTTTAGLNINDVVAILMSLANNA